MVVSDVRVLNRRLGKSQISKRLSDSRNGRNHRYQSEIDWSEQMRQNYRHSQGGKELRYLRSERQHAATNGTPLQIGRKMFGAKTVGRFI